MPKPIFKKGTPKTTTAAKTAPPSKLLGGHVPMTDEEIEPEDAPGGPAGTLTADLHEVAGASTRLKVPRAPIAPAASLAPRTPYVPPVPFFMSSMAGSLFAGADVFASRPMFLAPMTPRRRNPIPVMPDADVVVPAKWGPDGVISLASLNAIQVVPQSETGAETGIETGRMSSSTSIAVAPSKNSSHASSKASCKDSSKASSKGSSKGSSKDPPARKIPSAPSAEGRGSGGRDSGGRDSGGKRKAKASGKTPHPKKRKGSRKGPSPTLPKPTPSPSAPVAAPPSPGSAPSPAPPLTRSTLAEEDGDDKETTAFAWDDILVMRAELEAMTERLKSMEAAVEHQHPKSRKVVDLVPALFLNSNPKP